MEENRLTHNMSMSTWNTRKLKLMINNNNNNNQECKSPNSKGNEKDKADQEEGHSHENGNKVDESSETRVEDQLTGRERLKRHREEVKGQVKVPENWEQEQMLNEWVDYTTFDALFAPHRMIVTARDALIAYVRKARSQRLRIHT